LLDVMVTSREPEGIAWLLDEAGSRVDLGTVDVVWYRNAALPVAPSSLSERTVRFAQREAWGQALGTMISADAAWMSKPEAIWRANQKVFQLAAARRAGLAIPRTCVTRSPDEARSFIHSVTGNVIVKPVTYGTVEGTTPELAIYTTRLPPDLRGDDLAAIALAPVILQEEVTKRRDIRVTVIGEEVVAVAIESQSNAETVTDWRRPTGTTLEHHRTDLPLPLSRALRDFVRQLGLEFGAIDLVEKPDGSFVFLEINPNGQWGWLQLATGVDLAGAIARRLVQLSVR
jgi:glutathione synthase/RimK-type ligase-like ATP-grasp enzyme